MIQQHYIENDTVGVCGLTGQSSDILPGLGGGAGGEARGLLVTSWTVSSPFSSLALKYSERQKTH